MPETHETPEQGSFEIDPVQGAFVTPEAPEDLPSELRRTVIEPGIEAGRLAQQAAAAEHRRDIDPLNAIQADIGHNGDRAEMPLPQVVTSGYAPLLQRAVRNDGDIALQESIIEGMERARTERERARMDEEDRQRAKDAVSQIRRITDPGGRRTDRKFREQANRIEDEMRKKAPPPEMPRNT